MNETILIVGASARAAAHSAKRSGYRVVAADLYADSDLCDAAELMNVVNYPQGLVAAARSAVANHWLYTGAMENRPEIVDAISRLHPLLGNSGDVLRAVRDSFRVAEAFRDAGVQHPDVSRVKPTSGGRWLRKPLHSAGGVGIEFATGSQLVRRPSEAVECLDRKGVDAFSQSKGDGLGGPSYTAKERGASYYQQYIHGQSCSAALVAAGGRAQLLGVTEQLVGESFLGGREFQYCGSIGPLNVNQQALDQFRRIGNVLARDFGLVGLFGVDAILADNGIWPVEVNPRFTASLEVLERALGFNAITAHVTACRDERLADDREFSHSAMCGKGIVYAESDTQFTDAMFSTVQTTNQNHARPCFADIPHPGTGIRRGHPICSVLADGNSREKVLEEIERLATIVRS